MDEQYYQVAAPRSWGERLAIVARDRIYADMIRHCRRRRTKRFWTSACRMSSTMPPTCWSGNIRIRSASPRRVWARAMHSRPPFPKVTYRQIEANRPLPFADKAFDIAVSNAVLEHVGSVPHQAAFVRELSRVAKRVFISVPNRYFPVEHHTAIPLLHFWTRSFEAGLPMARQGGLGGREEFDFDVVAAPVAPLGARGGRPGHRPHRHHAGTVQLQPVSLHRSAETRR